MKIETRERLLFSHLVINKDRMTVVISASACTVSDVCGNILMQQYISKLS